MAQYRSRVAAVMQDDQLFAGTIEDNISFFDTEHDPARVRECARAAMIDDDITAMPMQYNTIVGSLGTALSGGQKQRVLLARALYRLPKILFLDEAFDQIDVALERRISTAISELGVALVLVSHRPETVASSVRRVEMQGPNADHRKGRSLDNKRRRPSRRPTIDSCISSRTFDGFIDYRQPLVQRGNFRLLISIYKTP
jgi:ABC-type bacteriocin/lantibiotic exporter with double-glycine peptidase domain